MVVLEAAAALVLTVLVVAAAEQARWVKAVLVQTALLGVYVVVVVPVVQAAARHQPAVNTAAGALALVVLEAAALQVLLEGRALFVLFGPALHDLIQALIRGTCNGTLYSNS
jgi:hypothetical protein